MRVVHLVSHGGCNGVTTTCKALVAAQLERGYEIMLVSPPGGWLTRQRFDGALQHVASRMLTRVGELRRIGLIARAWKPDVVHCHGAKASKYGAIWRVVAGSPVVTTAHATQPRLSFALARAVVAPSEEAAGYHIRHSLVPRRRMHVVANVVPRPLVTRTGARQEFRFDADDFVVAVVGAVGRRKNQIDALRIVKRLASRYPRLCMVIAGGQQQGETMPGWAEALADPEVASRVVMAGHRNDAADIIADSDALLSVSRAENGPTVAAEAMVLAVPVVCSRIGNVPDIVRHGVDGFMFDVGDVDAAADVLAGMIADRGFARAIGAAGARRIEDVWSDDKLIARLEAVYENVRVQPAGGVVGSPSAAGR